MASLPSLRDTSKAPGTHVLWGAVMHTARSPDVFGTGLGGNPKQESLEVTLWDMHGKREVPSAGAKLCQHPVRQIGCPPI